MQPSKALVEDLTLEGLFITKLEMIEDTEWPKRMQDYGYTNKQRAFVERSLAKKRELFEFKNHPDWKTLISDPKNDIEMFSRTSARGLFCLRATGHLDYSPKIVWLTLCGGIKYQQMYDKNIDESSTITKEAPNLYVMYQKSKSMNIINARDFIIVNFMSQVSFLCY